MSADLINGRDDLTFDIDSIYAITEYSQCPEVSRCQNEKIFNSLINTEEKTIKITVNDISDSISYNMINAIESEEYSSLNIIECLDTKMTKNHHIQRRILKFRIMSTISSMSPSKRLNKKP